MSKKRNAGVSRLAFGKSAEHLIASLMLRDGLSVYFPLADDHGVDAIIEKQNGELVKVQIKATSEDNVYPGWFIINDHIKQTNFYFVLYAEKVKTIWLLSSEELGNEASKGREGEWNIDFCGTRKGSVTIKENLEKYIVYPTLHGRKPFKRIAENG